MADLEAEGHIRSLVRTGALERILSDFTLIPCPACANSLGSNYIWSDDIDSGVSRQFTASCLTCSDLKVVRVEMSKIKVVVPVCPRCNSNRCSCCKECLSSPCRCDAGLVT